MSLVSWIGDGPWVPSLKTLYGDTAVRVFSDLAVLDADEEEVQFIGAVHVDGSGAKTFGTNGSKISWLPGAAITFAANSTLTVGVKKTSRIDTATGPAARATIGAAAFDVAKSLVGGVDTIGSTTWRDEDMTTGSPFTVLDGDLLAICFHLDTTAGTPSVKVRGTGVTTPGSPVFPTTTLITSGPTYAKIDVIPNLLLTFDDGTLGWLLPTSTFAVVDAVSGTIGQTNILGNIINLPIPVQIDGLAAHPTLASNAANLSLDLYSTPFTTPTLVEGVAVDGNVLGGILTGLGRMIFRKLSTPRTLTAHTDYVIGVRQTTATGLTLVQYDVAASAHHKPNGCGPEVYGVTSTGGTTFADALASNGGHRRRYGVWARVCAYDNGRRYRARAFTGF